jgi:hypothetical protein
MKALQILTGVLIMIGGLMMHSSQSLAADPEFGVTVGMRSNNVDPTSTYANSFTASGKSGLNFGALALIPIKDQFGFRTAFTYSQRFLSLDPKAGSGGVKSFAVNAAVGAALGAITEVQLHSKPL